MNIGYDLARVPLTAVVIERRERRNLVTAVPSGNGAVVESAVLAYGSRRSLERLSKLSTQIFLRTPRVDLGPGAERGCVARMSSASSGTEKSAPGEAQHSRSARCPAGALGAAPADRRA